MINPLLKVQEKKDEVLFKNVFNTQKTVKKIRGKDVDQVLKLLVQQDINMDFILVTKLRARLLNKIKSIMQNKETLYTKDSLLERVLFGLQDFNIEFIGPKPYELSLLEAINTQGNNKHYVVTYSSYDEVNKLLKYHKFQIGDTILFLQQVNRKIESLGPIFKVEQRTDLNAIAKEFKKVKNYVKLTNEKKIDILEEYLKALVDYFTDFYANYSRIWERQLICSNKEISLSERFIG